MIEIRAKLRILFLATLGLGAPATAFAGPFDYYGAGIHGVGMGATLTHGGDYGAVYYNPATLPDVENHAAVGFFATYSSAGIELKPRPEGYDIPKLTVGDALATSKQRRRRSHTKGPRPIYAVTGGGAHDLGIKDFRVGGAIFLPVNELLRLNTHYPDERERFFSNALSWEIADRQPARIELVVGVGYRLVEWLSLGLSGSYLPSADATLETYVEDVSDFSKVLLSSKIETTSSWAVTGGLLFDIPMGFRIGISTRTPLSFEVNANNTLQIKDVDETMEQQINWRPAYTPLHVDAGVSWHNDMFTFAADVRFNKWDNYRDSTYNPGGFHNTVDGRLGMLYVLNDFNTFRGGVSYIPTPVPDQTGRTNYVDNSRVRISLGGTHRLSFSDFSFEVGWAAQLHVLIPRDTNKATAESYPRCSDPQTELVCDEVFDGLIDSKTGKRIPEAQGLQTGNPGFPGWTSGGFMTSLQLELRI